MAFSCKLVTFKCFSNLKKKMISFYKFKLFLIRDIGLILFAKNKSS